MKSEILLDTFLLFNTNAVFGIFSLQILYIRYENAWAKSKEVRNSSDMFP
jgi:hypothetical protein